MAKSEPSPGEVRPRTAACFTAPASAAAFAPTVQVSRRTPRPLNLRSFDGSALRAIAVIGLVICYAQWAGGAPAVIRPMLDGYPGTPKTSRATATVTVPAGCTGEPAKSARPGRYFIYPPDGRTSGSVTIEVFFSRLDPTVAATPSAQARGYLDAIRDHSDSAVRSKRIGFVRHHRYGRVAIFHMHSDYWGERLYSIVVLPPLSISAELRGQGGCRIADYRRIFEQVVASLVVRPSTHHPDPGHSTFR